MSGSAGWDDKGYVKFINKSKLPPSRATKSKENEQPSAEASGEASQKTATKEGGDGTLESDDTSKPEQTPKG
ncbi:MAG: hypothetical protein M1839_003497 [Geoglossum umbratile]|nr:MAG: hypothetical protein M1839_003497 [Geoglossum umbratile]